MQCILLLATMEMRTEDTINLTIFFLTLNELLEERSGIKGYFFNPAAFISDHGGGNVNAVKMAFSAKTARTRLVSTHLVNIWLNLVVLVTFCRQFTICSFLQVGCKMHFMSDVHKRAEKLPKAMREEFIETCKDLHVSKTVFTYENLLDKLRVSVAPNCVVLP